jgi:hypothetical protein
MSQRDRPNRDRGFEDEPRRETRAAERPPEQPARRRESTEFDDETFDLPAWGSQQRQRPGTRESTERAGGPSAPREPDGDVARRVTRREPIPTLGDAFRRPNRRGETSPEDQSPTSVRDPYDRMRRVASKPQRQVRYGDEADFDSTYLGAYGDDEYPDVPITPRQSRTRRRPIVADRRAGPPRTPATRQIGGLIAAAGPQTRLIVGVGGFVLLSLVFMAATVAGRMSSVPDWIPIHLNAEGEPDLWGTSSTLWRIPLMVLMLSIMSGAVALYLWKRDQFAARFTLASTLLIHMLSWIALVNLVW